VSKD